MDLALLACGSIVAECTSPSYGLQQCIIVHFILIMLAELYHQLLARSSSPSVGISLTMQICICTVRGFQMKTVCSVLQGERGREIPCGSNGKVHELEALSSQSSQHKTTASEDPLHVKTPTRHCAFSYTCTHRMLRLQHLSIQHSQAYVIHSAYKVSVNDMNKRCFRSAPQR